MVGYTLSGVLVCEDFSFPAVCGVTGVPGNDYLSLLDLRGVVGAVFFRILVLCEGAKVLVSNRQSLRSFLWESVPLLPTPASEGLFLGVRFRSWMPVAALDEVAEASD